MHANSTSSAQPAYNNIEFTYTAPGADSFIPAASIQPFWRDSHNCSANQYPEPHDYSGLWSETWGCSRLCPHETQDR